MCDGSQERYYFICSPPFAAKLVLIMLLIFFLRSSNAVSALGVRTWKLSNVRKGHLMGDQNLLSRAPPFFERHVKLLVPAAFSTLAPANPH
jgi:hypothetical protein